MANQTEDTEVVIVTKGGIIKKILHDPKNVRIRHAEHIESYFMYDPEVLADAKKRGQTLPPKLKPPVVYTKGYQLDGLEMDGEDRRKYMWSNMKNSSPFKVDVARNYMLDQARRVSGLCLLEWASYGIHIANGGQQVRPIDVLRVVADDVNPAVEMNKSIHDNKEDIVLMTFLMNLRLARHTHAGSRRLFVDRCNNFLKLQFSHIDQSVVFYDSYLAASIIANDKGISRLTAAFDMVLDYLGPEDPYSYLKMGTLQMRYDEMQALNALCALADDLSMEIRELCTWGFNSAIGDDFEILLDVQAEFKKHGSYGPYIMSMKLNLRSAFSASQRAAAFAFVQYIGNILGIERSQKAYVVSCRNNAQVMENAKLAAYMFHHYRTMAKSLRPEGGEEEEVDPENELKGLPKQCDADLVFEWYKVSRVIPKAIEDFAHRKFLKIVHERDNTYGKMLKAQAKTWSGLDKRNFY